MNYFFGWSHQKKEDSFTLSFTLSPFRFLFFRLFLLLNNAFG